jgi:hypothetical protein
MFRVKRTKLFGVSRKSEKIIFLLEMLDILIGMIGTLPCRRQIGRFFESLTAATIQPLIDAFVDIPLFKRLL